MVVFSFCRGELLEDWMVLSEAEGRTLIKTDGFVCLIPGGKCVYTDYTLTMSSSSTYQQGDGWVGTKRIILSCFSFILILPVTEFSAVRHHWCPIFFFCYMFQRCALDLSNMNTYNNDQWVIESTSQWFKRQRCNQSRPNVGSNVNHQHITTS